MTKLIALLLIAAAGSTAAVTQTREVKLPTVPAPEARVPASRPVRPVPRILCQHPGTLDLRRFEDGSAQLLCAGRILVRIAVPG